MNIRPTPLKTIVSIILAFSVDLARAINQSLYCNIGVAGGTCLDPGHTFLFNPAALLFGLMAAIAIYLTWSYSQHSKIK